MSNTYTQIHIHAVFAVKDRRSLIRRGWKDDLYKYITAIVQSNNHKMLAINGMPDHLHILFGLRPTQSLSDLIREIKSSSSKWINEKGFVTGRFSWQEGFGAFSYAKKDLQTVINYIENQEKHHARRSFREEYLDFLRDFEVTYDERYLFQPIEVDYKLFQ
ncbi:MAG: IS200/IS605 family transposase [Bacteroidetes bacterium]|nr:IS200/IS605 family transposase [Bacteroidota bacterium]